MSIYEKQILKKLTKIFKLLIQTNEMKETKINQKITKEILMNELIAAYPEVTEILMDYGLNCVGCHFSSQDTLETGLKIHGLDHEINLILRDINRIISKKTFK